MRKRRLGLIQGKQPPSECPFCASILDGFTGISGGKPRKGDITFCLSCGNLLTFNKHLRVRAATPQETRAFDKLPEAKLMREFVAKTMAQRQAIPLPEIARLDVTK